MERILLAEEGSSIGDLKTHEHVAVFAENLRNVSGF